jgi:isoleucyl-tRNA synthetase
VQGFVRDAYTRHAFREAHLALFDFCNDTLSSVYCAAAKDRLYCDRADAKRRRQTQHVMRLMAEVLCRLLAPVLPHTADEAYRSMHGADACVQSHRMTHQAAYPPVAVGKRVDVVEAVVRRRQGKNP